MCLVFKMLLKLIAITMLAKYKNWGFHSSEDIDWGGPNYNITQHDVLLPIFRRQQPLPSSK
jgi:hypothetical protein